MRFIRDFNDYKLNFWFSLLQLHSIFQVRDRHHSNKYLYLMTKQAQETKNSNYL